MENWRCFYCDKGFVPKLPAVCPECKAELKKPYDDMTAEEKGRACAKKLGVDVMVKVTLAS